MHILAERFSSDRRMGILKAKHNLPAGDPGREEAQITRLRAMAKESAWTGIHGEVPELVFLR